MSKAKAAIGNINTNQEFRQCLLQSLSKFADNHTQQTAWDEVKELMTSHIINTERMNTFLYLISEQNQHMKISQKKEYIKLYGLAGEIFEETLLPFIPKIMGYMQKRLRDNDHHLHESCSEAIGVIVHHVLKNVEDFEEVVNTFEGAILKTIFVNLTSANKNTQIGAATCLSKIIQNAPIDALKSCLEPISEKLMAQLANTSCKCHTQVLESLISLILAVEEDFEPYAVNFLPYLLECMAMNDWATRKMAIDVIYTLAAILKEVLIPFKAEILEVLNHSRFDKYKPVREATLEAYQTIKNLGGDEEDHEVEEEPPKAKNTPSLRETIKQAKKANTKSKQPEPSFEIMDKSDNDKKLSAATQKRLENKRAQRTTHEDKKDTGPISYENIKSNVFKGPKNSNFFKKQKKEKAAEIEIFAAGDRDQFNYEEDMRQYKEQDEKIRRNKAQDEDFGIQIFEGKKPAKEESKEQDTQRFKRDVKEERKVRNEHEDRHGVKDPDDVPVHIYVKGNPKEDEERRRREERARQEFVERNSPKGQLQADIEELEEEVEVKGEEYEQSMNLLRQHQEMMKNKNNFEPTTRRPNPNFEVIQKQDSRDGVSEKPNFTTYAPNGPQYRVNNYQAPIQNFQYSQPQPDFLLQKRIEQFTQQMSASMANLQNYVRSEMSGVKQRLQYLESKVESIARRQNELELDRLNQLNKGTLEVNSHFDPLQAPTFDKDMFQSQSYSTIPEPKSMFIV